ncbi:hypothetical protein NQ318_011628 [Aromia moschata]|uniref:Huntingtin n=1 Tax=Aromia moschata TaxID=1265417 RepID=A0AAV8Z9V3_9CUCU|nr:hypothetical protein NQ318_011628 [Aromia moschata]
MATQEKLHKSLEALKNLANPNQRNLDVTKKKEKIQCCYVITEAISNPTIRISTNFHILLGNSIEALLKLCDDQDSDVRMTSEECLNRIIRAANEGHIGKIQIELHKEIKRNGEARPLRTALWLFSMLAKHIKPHKGKPYVVNMFPSLIKIAERTEESIHETLAVSLSKIMSVLGCFSSENEVKVLLKAFLANVSSQSTVIRRTTSTCILTICMNCRKPYTFLMYCLNYLLDLIVPVHESQSTHLILGVMSCIKVLLPNLKRTITNQEFHENCLTTKDLDKLLQVYELCLYFLTNKDHNIINTCLETLNVLLQNCTNELKDSLLKKSGINNRRIYSTHYACKSNCRSPSQLSVATNTTGEENLFSESELTDTVRSDIEKWIDVSKLAVMNITFAKTKEKSHSLDKVNMCAAIDSSQNLCNYEKLNIIDDNFVGEVKTLSIGDNLNGLMSDNSSEKNDDKLNVENDIEEIDIGDFLDKDVPLIYCTRVIAKLFLLSGSPKTCIPDKRVRVSVKSLALSCLSSIFLIYPSGVLLYLDKSYCGDSKVTNKRISSQRISELLLLKDHADPQLRGNVRMLVANFLKAVLTSSEGDYEKWLTINSSREPPTSLSMEELVKLLAEGLEDESSNCIRQTLLSLNVTFKYLAESSTSTSVIPLLTILPLLSRNPYWLVKVALCELVSKIDYITVHYVMGSSEFQRKVIFNVLFELLADDDQRVRTSAANSVVRIIPCLYFEEHEIGEEPATSKAVMEKNGLLKSLHDSKMDTSVNKKHFIRNMPFPFDQLPNEGCDRIDFSLSKITVTLYNTILTATSKHLIGGCIETLSLLSNSYPSTVYKNCWCTSDISKSMENASAKIPDLLSLCISFLSSSVHVYDLQIHIDILNLTANLYAGQSLPIIKPVVEVEGTKDLWHMFPNAAFSELSEQYLGHAIKLLNIFHHVLNEIVPIHPQFKAALPSLPAASNLSPIKRRKSDLDKKLLSVGKSEKEEKGEKKESVKMNSVVNFVSLPHYLKIYEVLKSSFTNYKISLESEASQKFLDLLNKALHSLSVLMEVGTLNEFSRIAEDILSYLKSTFAVEAPKTVENVQQLLKCLFGTNLTSNISEFVTEKKISKDESEDYSGFYYNVFQQPYGIISSLTASLSNISRHDCDGDSTLMGYLHRKDVKKRSVVLTRSSDKVLANYIRIFESMVIKSLKQYTVTSNVKLQCQVLQLLNQLVQLRVNYCLLDSEQVFIGFVLKQFEYIEEGQVPFPNELIPKIFQFLVQLSYSKQHSKCIISVPKIIQLCDGLMASGQPALTYCIPALEPIVEDIFLTRNKSNTSDIKELETTREVILSMLLRLCEYKQVINLITLILEDSKYCTDNTEKWEGWSRQVLGVVLPMLKQNKIRLDDSEAFVAMRRFILALNPNVFKPFDDIIIMFFQEPPQLEHDTKPFVRWLSKILILLLILTPLKEDTLLAKINKVKSEFSPNSIFENVITKADPLNVNNNADTFQKIPAEQIFIRFIFRVVSCTLRLCLLATRNEEGSFLCEQFSVFLMHFFAHVPVSHCKITNKAISVLNKNIPFDENDVIQLEDINGNFLNLAVFRPVLTFHWCYFLTLMNYSDKSFWSNVLRIKENSERSLRNPSIHLEIMKMGGAISFCDFLSENLTESENVSWFLINQSIFLVYLCNEAPVFEFVSSIHRSPILSKIFVENISKNYKNIPIFKTKVLKCVENCHPSQVGAVLNLLVPNMLNFRQVALSRMAANLASRKIELLLTLPMEDVNSQLSKEDIMEMQKTLTSLKLVRKHETLVSLLNKLSVQYYDLSPLEFDQRRVVNPEYIKRLKINKKWYLSQIQAKYGDASVRSETAELLNHLEYNEIISFMSSSDFNKLCLQDCLRLGVKYMEQHQLKEEPPIIKASVDCLLKDVTSIANRIPVPIQINEIIGPPLYADSKRSNVAAIFRNNDLSQLLCSIAPCIPCYMDSLLLCPNFKVPPTELMKFAVGCLDYVAFLIDTETNDLNINLVDSFVTAADRIFRHSNVCSFLTLDVNISWFCSSVNSLFRFVSFLLRNDKPLPSVPKYSLNSTLGKVETMPAGRATYQLYILVTWLFETKSTNHVNIPKFFFRPVKSIIISLSRLPLVNSYVLIPFRVWRTGWQPEMSGPFNTQVSPLPIELLQEVDMLEEYVFRMTLLGDLDGSPERSVFPLDDLDPVELNAVVHGSSLAIKAITTLLLQTLSYPTPGYPKVSKLIHVSRDLPVNEDSVRDKYNECTHVSTKSELLSVFEPRNFERLSNKYSYGQMSIKYFLMATGILQEDEENSMPAVVVRRREKMLEDNGLDINSCLQFLLDYYMQLMKPQSLTNIRILHDAIRSTIIISDLFTDKSQFSWMMDVFLELSSCMLSKTNCCIKIFEQVKKLLVQYLKSPYLSSRIASLHGLLYILEGCKLSNITIGGISEEMQLILPCAVEYVQFNLTTTNSVLKKSQEHSVLVWSLAFYLMENVDEVNMEQKLCGVTEIIDCKKSLLIEKVGKQILKLALDKMRCDNPTTAILGMQLLLSYMYTDCADHLQKRLKFLQPLQTSPDHLVQTIEKISAIFERIKRGHVFEVDILCSIMPIVLDDFFSPSDILTKVFESAICQDQLSLLQDWVVFSLSNFTQSFSIGMATWCLTCFFISASSNEWLRSYFLTSKLELAATNTRTKRCCASRAQTSIRIYRTISRGKSLSRILIRSRTSWICPSMIFYRLCKFY